MTELEKQLRASIARKPKPHGLHANAKANLRNLESLALLRMVEELTVTKGRFIAWDASPACRRALSTAINQLTTAAMLARDTADMPAPERKR